MKDQDDKKIIQLDEAQLREYPDRQIMQSVEETLNRLLDAEVDRLCGAGRYERSPERVDTRAGHYERKLHTKAGEVSLKVPKLRSLPFETQIIEHYKRCESSVEEALMEMYLAGVSARSVLTSFTAPVFANQCSCHWSSSVKVRQVLKLRWRARPII